jgi:hypothetical protein
VATGFRCLSSPKYLWHTSCPILKIGVNGVSTNFGIGSWVIYVLQCGNNSYMMLWHPFHLKQCMTPTIPHDQTERQRSVHSIWSCILGNQGLVWINKHITELLTASAAKNTKHHRKNTYSKTINVADCKPCKTRLLAVE